MKSIILWYFIIINVMAFFTYGIDKRKAVKGSYRIPEAFLMGLAVLGGSPGAFAGMRYFHHKTRKPKFFIGVPVIFAVQLFLFVLLWL